MRKIVLLTFLIAALTGMAAAKGNKGKRLVILHTNDTHSAIMPFSNNLADKSKAGFGGAVRRAAVVAEARKEDKDLLLFDSGDYSQGSMFYALFKGDVEIGLMNGMKYDAAAIGNHEFDFGLENMVRLFRKAKFPVVCANYDFSGTPLEGIVKPYVVLKRKGLKIGVFGLSPKITGLIDAKVNGGVKYLDPVQKASETAALLRAKGCDIVICLSHLGWELGGDDDNKVVSGTRDIDLVLGGHSHTLFKDLMRFPNKDGVLTPIGQNGKSGIYMGKIEIDLERR